LANFVGAPVVCRPMSFEVAAAAASVDVMYWLLLSYRKTYICIHSAIVRRSPCISAHSCPFVAVLMNQLLFQERSYFDTAVLITNPALLENGKNMIDLNDNRKAYIKYEYEYAGHCDDL